MSNIDRKLVTLRTVSELEPIEGADMIELATVDGWKCIVKKNTFKVGDIAVYHEVDSFLPVHPRYEFLRKGCFKSTQNLGDGYRIRSMKMKGVLSQGLLLPVSDFDFSREIGCNFGLYTDESGNKHYIDPNTDDPQDLTEILGVQKYEKPIPSNMVGKVRGSFPSFIFKTDQERIQNIFRKRDWKSKVVGQSFEVTLKLDGTSFTAYCKDGDIGVCSRTQSLKLEEENWENAYVKMARESGLLDALVAFNTKTGRSVAVQGELMGNSIQGNRENLKEPILFIFDVFDIDAQAYLLPKDRTDFVAYELYGLVDHKKVTHVPLLGTMTITEEDELSDLLAKAEIKSLNHDVAEGIVLKSLDSQFSFKIISNRFLLGEKD